MLKDLRHIN